MQARLWKYHYEDSLLTFSEWWYEQKKCEEPNNPSLTPTRTLYLLIKNTMTLTTQEISAIIGMLRTVEEESFGDTENKFFQWYHKWYLQALESLETNMQAISDIKSGKVLDSSLKLTPEDIQRMKDALAQEPFTSITKE